MSFDQAVRTTLERLVDAVNESLDAPAVAEEPTAPVMDASQIRAGVLDGWDVLASGDEADQPTTLTYTRDGAEVTAELTWGTTGGEDGNVTVVEYSYAAAVIATRTITYDVDGNVTTVAWS